MAPELEYEPPEQLAIYLGKEIIKTLGNNPLPI